MECFQSHRRLTCAPSQSTPTPTGNTVLDEVNLYVPVTSPAALLNKAFLCLSSSNGLKVSHLPNLLESSGIFWNQLMCVCSFPLTPLLHDLAATCSAPSALRTISEPGGNKAPDCDLPAGSILHSCCPCHAESALHFLDFCVTKKPRMRLTKTDFCVGKRGLEDICGRSGRQVILTQWL